MKDNCLLAWVRFQIFNYICQYMIKAPKSQGVWYSNILMQFYLGIIL